MQRTLILAALAFAALAVTGAVHAADPPYIYGIHDSGGEQNMADFGTRGWIVFTEEIGSDPNNLSGRDYSSWTNAGYGVIVRLNNGYGSAGTLPYDTYYDNFAARCANYISHSSAVNYWIIGNECNLPREWPGNNNGDPSTGQPITVSRYVNCYNKCYTAIKNAVPSAQVSPAPSGTWAPPYPAQGIEGFVDYWVNCLNGIGASKIDGLMLHAYTHGCDPSLVTSDQMMGPPYDTIYYQFRVYKNYMWAIPGSMQTKPVMITECDENVECADGGAAPRHTWYNSNNGWVRAVYSEINSWNQANSQKIRCVALFRWTDTAEGEWNFGIQYRQGVIDDWRAAMAYGYTWGTSTSQNDANSGTDAGNDFSSALPISPGSYTGWCSNSTDPNDYYKFAVTSGNSISISMTPPSGSDFDIYLYNPSGTLKASSEAGGSTTETINFTADSSGDWRLRVYAYSGSGTYSFSVTIGGNPSGTNLLLNAPTYLECGHNQSDQRGKRIRDGNLSTKWCCLHNGISSSGDHWLAWDLGSTCTVTGYVVKHASLGGEPTYYNTKTFYIESAPSLMGPWTTEFYVDNTSQVASNTMVYGTPKSLRYIRLRVTQPNFSADWAVRIPEFEVWGTAGALGSVTIEAENYDRFYGAVDGTQYHDSDSTNSGGQYRSQGVDIENCSEGTYNVGWTAAGEWLIYPWKATQTTYTPTIRYAGTSNGTVRILVDGVDKTGAISLPPTGAWQTWATKNVPAITVTTGEHDIKFQMDSAGFNINYFTLTPGGSPPSPIASEDFESMPSWSSSYNATWGSAASWAIVSGGQSGNFLRASRSSQGSSAKVKVYTVPQNTNVTISVYMKCPSYSGGTYWVESAYKLGNYSAQDFDGNGGTWTLIQKFSNSGYPNGNGNVWTQYSVTVNTGSNTQISIGYKHGASGCTGPTVGWDTFRIQ